MYTTISNFSRFTTRHIMMNWTTGKSFTWYGNDEFAFDHYDKVDGQYGNDLTIRTYEAPEGSNWILRSEINTKIN